MHTPTKKPINTMSTMAELNVTPLLDLAFVLLVIFMITAPFLSESADLIIPSSTASREAIDPSLVHVVSVDQNRALSLGDEEVDETELLRRLEELKAGSEGEVAIVIKSDKRLSVEELVKVMDVVKNAGITKVGVVTRPESDSVGL